jgi:hypothetical protein
MQLSPRLGVIYQTKSLKEITLGLSAKYYPVKKTVSPFIAFNLGALYYERAGQYVSMAGEIIPLQNSVSGFTDFTFGPGFGGEYFINENFSVGIEGQLNFTAATQKSFQYSPGTLNFSTAALIYATVYF